MQEVIRECAYAVRIPLLMNVLTAILTGTLGVITADTLGKFADSAFDLNFSMGIKHAAALLLCLFFVIFAVPFTGMLSDFVMFKESLRHDQVIFGHYLNKEIQKGVSLGSGNLQYELEDAPNLLRIQWVRLLGKAVSLPFCLGYFLYYVGKISWGMAGLLFAIAAAKLTVLFFFKEKLAEYDRQEKTYQAKRRDYEADIVSLPYIIKMWEIWQGARSRVEELFWEYYHKSAVHQIACKVSSEQAQELTNQVTMVLLLLAGAVMVAGGSVTPGEFASLFIYLTVAQGFLNDLGEIIQNYPLLKNAAERVCGFYQDEEITGGEPVKHFLGISGEKISFSYPGKKVFENLDFEIMAGEKIRICGENGRGKSTWMKILCTSLESYEGRVEISGHDFRVINKTDWRKLIACAPQTPFLFHETVRENILMGNNKAGEEDADCLMREFGIWHLADRRMEEDTSFSGGEKQKISLVRALLKDSEVLLLDEPTNHLDQESIRVLKKYLRETKKTVILITHDTILFDVASRCIQIG